MQRGNRSAMSWGLAGRRIKKLLKGLEQGKFLKGVLGAKRLLVPMGGTKRNQKELSGRGTARIGGVRKKVSVS